MAYFNNKQNIKGGEYLPTPLPSFPEYNPPAIPTQEEGSDVNIPTPTFSGQAKLYLYVNCSDNSVLDKNITKEIEFDIMIKQETPLLSPSVIIETEVDLTNYNYCFIDKTKRFYYANITLMDNGLYIIEMEVDPLMSFKEQIKEAPAIVTHCETLKNNYINDYTWVSDVRKTTNIINFPNSFNNEPQFVLITAGVTI